MSFNWRRLVIGLILGLAAAIAIPTLAFLVYARPAGSALHFVVLTAGSMEAILLFLWWGVKKRGAGETSPAQGVTGGGAGE